MKFLIEKMKLLSNCNKKIAIQIISIAIIGENINDGHQLTLLECSKPNY